MLTPVGENFLYGLQAAPDGARAGPRPDGKRAPGPLA